MRKVNKKMTERELLNLVKENSWNYISVCKKLSEEFIEKYSDKVYWGYISEFQKLSEEFIEKYYDKVDWFYISRYQKLSEEFIEKYSNKVDWSSISEFQKLSEEFIEKYYDKVDWFYILQYQKLSEEFLSKYDLQKPKDSWLYVTKEEKLDFIKKNTSYEVEEIIELIKKNKYKEKDKIIIDGDEIRITKNLLTFVKKGISCSSCGIIGKYFRKFNGNKYKHLVLYAIGKNNKHIKMTSDHIIPLSKNGSDSMENRQTMCYFCNVKKGDLITEKEIENGCYKMKTILVNIEFEEVFNV